MSKFNLQRLGILMKPEPVNPQEVEGVPNPAASNPFAFGQFAAGGSTDPDDIVEPR